MPLKEELSTIGCWEAAAGLGMTYKQQNTTAITQKQQINHKKSQKQQKMTKPPEKDIHHMHPEAPSAG